MDPATGERHERALNEVNFDFVREAPRFGPLCLILRIHKSDTPGGPRQSLAVMDFAESPEIMLPLSDRLAPDIAALPAAFGQNRSAAGGARSRYRKQQSARLASCAASIERRAHDHGAVGFIQELREA